MLSAIQPSLIYSVAKAIGVESEETWIGDKHKVRGGYTDNKTFVSLVGRGGNVRSTPITKVTGKNLDLVLSAHVDPGAVLMTDESRNYKSVGLEFREHHTVNHRDGEYVRGDVTTNTVEGYFANLKRGLDGVYHHVGSHYLVQYLREFDFRYNTRKLTGGHRSAIGIQKTEGKRLKLRAPC